MAWMGLGYRSPNSGLFLPRSNAGFSGDWRRGESNPHLRIANAPTDSCNHTQNRTLTENAETVLARRWALCAQKDARLATVLDCWERLDEQMKNRLSAMAVAQSTPLAEID